MLELGGKEPRTSSTNVLGSVYLPLKGTEMVMDEAYPIGRPLAKGRLNVGVRMSTVPGGIVSRRSEFIKTKRFCRDLPAVLEHKEGALQHKLCSTSTR